MERKKIFILVTFLLMLTALFFGCSAPTFDDLEIVAYNVDDVMPGEYTLDYTITNIDEISKDYAIDIWVYVVDKDNNTINVQNNRTFEVVANNIYYVQINVGGIFNGNYQTKKKDIIITAIKTDPKLYLKFYILDYPQDWTYIELKSGQSVLVSSLPEIPDTYPSKQGMSYTITNKEWIYFDDKNNEQLVTDEYLSNITSDMTIYAKFTYSMTPRVFTITFETNGGSEIADIKTAYNASISKYAPVPTKENNFFLGWYEDSELTKIHIWESTMKTNLTLYAKWEEYDSNSTDYSYFTFTKKNETFTDIDHPYQYYEIKVKEGVTLPSEVIVPNGYNNCPVAMIGNSCFANHSEITSITLPSHIFNLSNEAFSGCTNLSNVIFEDGISITTFSSKLFKDCVSLISLDLPDSVVKITSDCFSGVNNLTTLNISKDSSLSNIVTPTTAFHDTNITHLTLPPSCIITTAITNKNNEIIQIEYYQLEEDN